MNARTYWRERRAGLPAHLALMMARTPDRSPLADGDVLPASMIDDRAPEARRYWASRDIETIGGVTC